VTPPFKFDEIGDWSELKLEIVENYGSAYTKAFANQKGLKKILHRRVQRSGRPFVQTHARTGRR